MSMASDLIPDIQRFGGPSPAFTGPMPFAPWLKYGNRTDRDFYPVDKFLALVQERLIKAFGIRTAQMIAVQHLADGDTIRVFGYDWTCCDLNAGPSLETHFLTTAGYETGWNCAECGNFVEPQEFIYLPVREGSETHSEGICGDFSAVAGFFNVALRNRTAGRLIEEHYNYHQSLLPQFEKFVNDWWAQLLEEWVNGRAFEENAAATGAAVHEILDEGERRELYERFGERCRFGGILGDSDPAIQMFAPVMYDSSFDRSALDFTFGHYDPYCFGDNPFRVLGSARVRFPKLPPVAGATG